MQRRVSATSFWKFFGHIFDGLHAGNLHGQAHQIYKPPFDTQTFGSQTQAEQPHALKSRLAADDFKQPRHYPPHHCSYLDNELVEREITDHD